MRHTAELMKEASALYRATYLQVLDRHASLGTFEASKAASVAAFRAARSALQDLHKLSTGDDSEPCEGRR
jgi:hypothetical protein